MVEALPFIASVGVGVVLVVSGSSKLRDLAGFVRGVQEYEVLPLRLARLYGYSLPFLEIAFGAMLLLGMFPPATAAVVAILLMSFAVGVSINLVRGRRPDCHCFGPGKSERIGTMTLIRLGLLITAAVIAGRGPEFAWSVLPSVDLLPGVLISFGSALILYLLEVMPKLWQIWRTPSPKGLTYTTGRVNLRELEANRGGCSSVSS